LLRYYNGSRHVGDNLRNRGSSNFSHVENHLVSLLKDGQTFFKQMFVSTHKYRHFTLPQQSNAASYWRFQHLDIFLALKKKGIDEQPLDEHPRYSATEALRPVYTGDFCCDFSCDFLLLEDVKE
jgi:hypothetical protein